MLYKKWGNQTEVVIELEKKDQKDKGDEEKIELFENNIIVNSIIILF